MAPGGDVVVVGGGIIGCALARELALAGADVLLLERHELAHGASGRNHGLLIYPQNAITAPLWEQSLLVYGEVAAAAEVDVGLDAEPRGFLVLVRTEDEWEAAEREARASQEGGVTVEMLTQRDLVSAEPELNPDLIGAWYIGDGRLVDPAALTLALALEARAAGADIATHTDVKQILARNDRVTGVATDAGVVQASVVIDAAGPWAPKLARTVGIDLPISGARGWLILTQEVEFRVNHVLQSAGWHLLGHEVSAPHLTVEDLAGEDDGSRAEVGLLLQQHRAGNVMLGGSRIVSTRDDPEQFEVTREIAQRAVATIPSLSGAQVAAVWSGVRPMSHDGLPLIGWTGVEGLFVVGGHGGQGVILGAGSARLGRQLIGGASTFTDPAPFDPLRPFKSA